MESVASLWLHSPLYWLSSVASVLPCKWNYRHAAGSWVEGSEWRAPSLLTTHYSLVIAVRGRESFHHWAMSVGEVQASLLFTASHHLLPPSSLCKGRNTMALLAVWWRWVVGCLALIISSVSTRSKPGSLTSLLGEKVKQTVGPKSIVLGLCLRVFVCSCSISGPCVCKVVQWGIISSLCTCEVQSCSALRHSLVP